MRVMSVSSRSALMVVIVKWYSFRAHIGFNKGTPGALLQ